MLNPQRTPRNHPPAATPPRPPADRPETTTRPLPAVHLHPAVERRLASARPRLLRVARLLGVSAEGAEDVVQETLLAAWSGLDSLRDGERFDAWLDGICRNHARRWLRAHAARATRELPLSPRLPLGGDEPTDEADPADPQPFDPDEELTRRELATLLDRALGFLHPSAREPLVLRYVGQLPTAAIAARLGISAGAVELRLHRARRELHALLSGELRGEAEAFGLTPDLQAEARGDAEGEGRSGGRATHIWCPLCGENRLFAELDRATGEAHFWCPTCGPRLVPGQPNHIVGTNDPRLLAGVTSHKSILARMLGAVGDRYARGLASGQTTCIACGRPAQLGRRLPEEAPSELRDIPGLHIRCPVCDIVDVADIWRLTLDQPAAQRFWRAHPRIRVLPDFSTVERAGRPAIVSSVVSVRGDARMDFVWAPETLDVLEIHGDPPGD